MYDNGALCDVICRLSHLLPCTYNIIVTSRRDLGALPADNSMNGPWCSFIYSESFDRVETRPAIGTTIKASMKALYGALPGLLALRHR